MICRSERGLKISRLVLRRDGRLASLLLSCGFLSNMRPRRARNPFPDLFSKHALRRNGAFAKEARPHPNLRKGNGAVRGRMGLVGATTILNSPDPADGSGKLASVRFGRSYPSIEKLSRQIQCADGVANAFGVDRLAQKGARA